MGKKEKKQKKVKEAAKPVLPQEESADVKEVLQLFNKIEELVVDGDPRIREALNQKPGIQNLLRDDSSLYGLSPRSMMMPGQNIVDSDGLIKEATNASLLSQKRLLQQNKQLSPNLQRIPVQLQAQAMNRSPRKNIIVPPIAIPEHSTLGDTFSDGYHAALIKQHPDGTLESTRVERQIPVTTQPEIRRQVIQKQNPVVFQPQQATFPVQVQHPRNSLVFRSKQTPKKQAEKIASPRYHSFVYDDGKEANTVQIHMGEIDATAQESTAQERKKSPSLPRRSVEENIGRDLSLQQLPNPQFQSTLATEYIAPTISPIASTKQSQTAVYSKVIGEEGGSITCFGCKLQVPKNGVDKKCLFRISILDISQVPHKTDRIFYHTQDNVRSVVMPITPAIKINPVDTELLKPITITLPTCAAVEDHMQTESGENEATTSEDHNDIKADNIIVKFRNKDTKDVWVDTEIEVFRSSDSIIFKTQDLGDVCAFYKSGAENGQILNKRLSLFLFKSSDNRKKQFISILITEDLPHVIQKGIESMPQWLKYTDSCSNITIPEGNNLVVYIEAVDRTACSTDANKIDIPWENLWHPECTIRKHVHVTLVQRDAPAFVQVFVDDGKIILNSEFTWMTKHHAIRMPDLMTTGEGIAVEAQDETWQDDNERLEMEMLKKVTWKPETPVSKFVTNKGLLSYAAMQ